MAASKKKTKRKSVSTTIKVKDAREFAEKYSLAQITAALRNVVEENRHAEFELEGNVWAPYYSNYDHHVQRMVRKGVWGDELNYNYRVRVLWKWLNVRDFIRRLWYGY